MRLRSVALPHLRVTVRPTRGLSSASPSLRRRISSRANVPLARVPPRAARKSERFVRRAGKGPLVPAVVPDRQPAWPTVLMPTASCGPWRGAVPALSGRRRSPCGRGSRGGVCGPGGMADTCVWSSSYPPCRGRPFRIIACVCLRAGRPHAQSRRSRGPSWRGLSSSHAAMSMPRRRVRAAVAPITDALPHCDRASRFGASSRCELLLSAPIVIWSVKAARAAANAIGWTHDD